MHLKRKILIVTFFVSLSFLLLVGINTSLALDLQVDIPGQEALDFDGTTKPIGQYIKNIYNYAISIVGIVATIMLMFGGFTWLTAGGSGEKVGKARDIIFGALTGLVLALTSYTILTLINPDLVNFKILKVETAKKTDFESTKVSGYSQTIGCNITTPCPPPLKCGSENICFDPTSTADPGAKIGCCLSMYNKPTKTYTDCNRITFALCNGKSDGDFTPDQICKRKSGSFGQQYFICE